MGFRPHVIKAAIKYMGDLYTKILPQSLVRICMHQHAGGFLHASKFIMKSRQRAIQRPIAPMSRKDAAACNKSLDTLLHTPGGALGCQAINIRITRTW